MPKQSPVPVEFDKPFYDACNEERLVVHSAQYPASATHLPGTPVDEVPIGAAVEVIFETTPATGQKVPEWRVAG